MASNGVYGTRVAANITSNDVEIFYSYSPTRNSDSINTNKFTKLDSSILTNADADGSIDNVLEGVMNLKLPLQYFNKKGFYTVYIRPKEVPAVISNVSTLTAYPDVRGIIIDYTKVTELRNELETNNGLVGYRIIYLNNEGKRENFYRIVTSNNKCEPVEQSLPNVNQNATRYRFNEGGSITFITVTPSVAPSFKPNAQPFIGQVGQQILFVNTKFEPIMLDIEMTENDADTIYNELTGSQLRDLDNGLVTTFNNNNEIISQHEFYTLKDKMTTEPIYEVKIKKTDSIDFSQTLEDK